MLKICIIDDHELTAFTLSEMFKALGHEARFISSTKEALKAVREGKLESDIDYYIVDLYLNGISGLDVYHELEKSGVGNKVVFISGCEPKDDIFKEALLLNVPLVMKRFNATELVNQLNNGTVREWANEALVKKGIVVNPNEVKNADK